MVSLVVDFGEIEQFKTEIFEKTLSVIQHLQDEGHNIERQPDTRGVILPAKVKNSEYDLVVQKITFDSRSHKSYIYFTGAFLLSGVHERTSFELITEFSGETGIVPCGNLSLLESVNKTVGETSMVIQAGSHIRFNCCDIEEFNLKFTWVDTSPITDYQADRSSPFVELQETEIYSDDPLIRSVVVYPNPTNGQFEVEIELREIADIQLTIFDMASGTIIDDRQESGTDYYRINYNQTNLNSGVFILILTTGNEQKQMRIVIQR